MAIVDAPLVKIEISILDDNLGSTLQLNYHGQRYDLVQAFTSHKLELAQQRWQQRIAVDDTVSGRYLLVREVDYYSLWMLERSLNPACLIREYNHHNLELQQASIWLFQELWLQWQDLLGERQLHIFADDLLDLNLPLRSRTDLDRLLSLDPLADEPLSSWTQADFIAFDRQLYDLTQHKMGQKFGQKLTIDIIESMPDSLQTILMITLDLETQLDIPQHD